MRTIIASFSLLCIVVCAGCYKRHLEPLEPTVIEKVCTEPFGPFYDERKYSRYHYVSFEGYIAIPKSVMISNTMFVDIYQKPNREGIKLSASFTVGTRKNQVERLKSNYKESDLKIESNSGVALGNGSKVKIEGEVSPGAVPGNWIKSCYVRVEKIEKAD